MNGLIDRAAGVATCLAVLIVSLCSHACGDFGSDYQYGGAYRVADGLFEVRSVFNASESPVVLATHRDASKGNVPEELWMVPLNGNKSCSVGRAEGYLASADERGFRLALFSPVEGLSFFTESCERVDLDLTRVERLQLVVKDGLYVYLGEGGEGELSLVDPFEGTRRTLAEGVSHVYGSRLVVNGGGEVGRWLVGVDGSLRLQGLSGSGVDSGLSGVQDVVIRPGVGVDGGPLEYLTVARGTGVTLYRAAVSGSELVVVEVWSRDDACAPRAFDLNLSECTSGVCETAASPLIVGSVPWVSVESPCMSGTLQLISGGNVVSGPWEGAADDYRIVPDPRGGSFWLLYNVLEGSVLTMFQVRVGSGGEVEQPHAQDDALALGSLAVDRANASYSAVTAEVPSRYGTWTPGEGFVTLVSEVESSRNGLILHHVQGGAGLLSYCWRGVCDQVAKGVPREQFRLYATVPRFDESEPVVAYLSDFDSATQTGTLGVFFPEANFQRDLADGVTSFEPVENGAVHGIAYTTGIDGAEGLWFAPR